MQVESGVRTCVEDVDPGGGRSGVVYRAIVASGGLFPVLGQLGITYRKQKNVDNPKSG